MYKIEIDTASLICRISLFKKGKKVVSKEWKPKMNEAKTIYTIFAGMIKKYPDLRENLDEVKVNEGPGSFTGTRIGVSTANVIAFITGAKLKGFKSNKVEKIIKPLYDRKPNISKAKKKEVHF